MVLTKPLGWAKNCEMSRCEIPLFSFSISTSMRLLDTKAISMPEKKAEKAIETRIPTISDISMGSFIIAGKNLLGCYSVRL